LVLSIATACGFNKTLESSDPCGTATPPTVPPKPSVFGGLAQQATIPPPPLSGGTLAVLSRGKVAYAIASVPETNRIEIIRFEQEYNQGLQTSWSGDAIMLAPGEEPGRIAEDDTGRVHVVLRGSGSVLTFEPTTATIVARRSVCPAPRGIAYDTSGDVLHVVCATGELVTLPAAGGPPTRIVRVERDLRDVVVLANRTLGNRLLVTRFRSAEVLTLDMQGTIVARVKLPTPDDREPTVAWRMTEKHGKVAIAYQLESSAPIDIRAAPTVMTSAYGGATMNPSTKDGLPLVVAAIATTTDGRSFSLDVDTAQRRAAPMFDVAIDGAGGLAATGPALFPANALQVQIQEPGLSHPPISLDGRQIPAMAFGEMNGSSFLFVQTREPSAIQVLQSNSTYNQLPTLIATVPIAGVSDVGFDLFHTLTPAGIACASCHPEGSDDGHVWHFITQDLRRRNDMTDLCVSPGTGPAAPANSRRTQSLRGGILTTVPLHWDGDMGGMGDILSEVFTHRMGGGSVTKSQQRVVERWLNSIPRLPQRTDLDSARVDAGRALFEGKGACVTCHSGPMLTNNLTLDVGRGALQVPNLVGIGDRAPFLHDGCAATLAGRFDPSCGGSRHGAALSPDEESDVVSYLESL
jgi:hypothetical protein